MCRCSYMFKMEWIPGKDNTIAGGLSRVSPMTVNLIKSEIELPIHQVNIIKATMEEEDVHKCSVRTCSRWNGYQGRITPYWTDFLEYHQCQSTSSSQKLSCLYTKSTSSRPQWRKRMFANCSEKQHLMQNYKPWPRQFQMDGPHYVNTHIQFCMTIGITGMS